MSYESFLRFEEWREEQEEMWMWGCKRNRTVRSSIRMCWYHIFSEDSVERFVLRARASPSCATECVKMHYHDSARNQKQECWRWLLVFLVGVYQSSYVPSRMRAKASFLDDNQEQQTKCEWFSVLISERRKGPVQPGYIVFLVRCSVAHAPSHVSPQVCTFIHPLAVSCQRIGPVVLQTLCNHGENLSESFVRSLFLRYTVCFSVLVLKMSCSPDAVVLKSCPSWLCDRNSSSPPRCDNHCRRPRNLMQVPRAVTKWPIFRILGF